MSYSAFGSVPATAFAGWLDPEAHDYAIQVDSDVRALDADVAAQSVGLGTQFSVGAWDNFARAFADPGSANGWFDYFSHLTRIHEITAHDQVMADIGGYQRRLREFYKQFIAAGGKPTNPEPTIGFDPQVAAAAESKLPTPWYEKAVTWTLVLGSLFAVGYLLHGIGQVGSVAQKAGLFEGKKR